MSIYTWNGITYQELQAEFAWVTGSHDGPMSGIVMYLCEPYYARCHQVPGSRNGKPRYYWLYPLTGAEFRLERALHNKWKPKESKDNSIWGQIKSFMGILDELVFDNTEYCSFYKEHNFNRLRQEYTNKETIGYFRNMNWHELNKKAQKWY